MELEGLYPIKLPGSSFTDLDLVSEERRDVKVILRLLVSVISSAWAPFTWMGNTAKVSALGNKDTVCF